MRALGFGLGVSFAGALPLLAISPATVTVVVGSTGQTFTASGGSGVGYTYSLHTNASGGSVNSSTGVYTQGATPGTDVVRVTDSLGSTADATVTVNAALQIAPSSVNLMTHSGSFSQSMQTFTATGGSGTGYTYTLVSSPFGSDNVNAGTGIYTACTTVDISPKSRTVRVTDSLGNTSDATIDVYTRLAIDTSSSGTNWSASLGSGAVQSHTFTATGGSGAGKVWGLSSTTNSTIDASSAVFVGGDVVGSIDTVTVTDSLGFVASTSWTVAIFRPEDVYTPIAIYDGRFALTTIGGAASEWDDRTGDTSKNLVQATSGARPTAHVPDAAYNNQITLESTAGAQFMASGTWGSALTQPFTMYVVGQISTSTPGLLFAGEAGGPAINNANVATNWELVDGVAFVEAAVSPATPAVVCGVFNGGSSAIYVTDHTTAKGTGNPGTGNMTAAGLFANPSPGFNCAGKVGMAIVYSGTHSTAQRARIFTQLGSLYGIATT